MPTFSRKSLLLVLFAAACTAQDASPPADAPPSGNTATLVTDLVSSVGTLETKIVDLAMAIPDSKYDWKPQDARSVRQVLLHVAADNYLLPAMLGASPDPATGITTDYATAVAFENRGLAKDSVVAELRKSFAFIKQTLTATPASKMNESVTMFGQPFTGQSAWILAVTHLHEHLGQLIAYARTNGVKPPWS
jgi:uncharacterized damage-inducible protein DinB